MTRIRVGRPSGRHSRLTLTVAAVVATVGLVASCTPSPAPVSHPLSASAAPAPTTPASTPRTGNPDWTPTAPSPLGTRYDALAFYAEGRYYVLGGYTGMTAEIWNNDQGLHGDPVFDGASYDPATDTWTRLPSFTDVFPWVTASSAAAIVDGRLYVVSPLGPPLHVDSGEPTTGERKAAVLDLRPGGGWTALPAPPATHDRGDQLLMSSTDGVALFADGDSTAGRGAFFAFATTSWTPLPRPPQRSLDNPQAALLDATHLWLRTESSYDADDNERPGGNAIFDLSARKWRAVRLLDAESVPTQIVGGLAAFDTYGPGESAPPQITSCHFAGIAGATTDRCTTVKLTADEASTIGGLTARMDDLGGSIATRPLSTGNAVESQGKLFDPRTQVLWQVPALPGVTYPKESTEGGPSSAVMAAGSGSVLSCFGYTHDADTQTLTNHDQCYLLTVPDPLPGTALH
ncbi:hypothetical protein ATK74_2518 [Propionicimonas paludicola]|uniref:Kelch motif protein n=1 Tax=Propionicimonas paludicola TaxID=185243 RepID=A0A2A9CWC9_9ACTN|nr:hypothetical protein ATK74_2518 [Propionicimonas paludicola]